MVGVVDSAGNIIVKSHFATHTADCYAHFSDCHSRFKECLSAKNIDIDKIDGIGVNMPGMVDFATGLLLQAPFARWYNIDVKRSFASMFENDRIFVENDVNSCAMGELMFGNACDNFLWVTVSTGIGGALVIDRKLVHGFSSCAGEAGHVKVEYDNPEQCSCKQWGCAEAHGSGTAITRMFSKKVSENVEIANILAEKKLIADAKSCSILAKEGNTIAIDIFQTAGKYLGRALSYAANLFNPQKIYIGGGVSDSLELLSPSLREEFEKATVKQNADVEIVKTSLSYDAALIGAAALAAFYGEN